MDKKILQIWRASAVFFILAPSPLLMPAASQSFEDGLSAYRRGDYATTLENWRPLAEKGEAATQYNLGLMHEKGQGVVQDYAKAVKWYRLAAEQGYPAAQNSLGLMYALGQGVLQDWGKAYMWSYIAAANGANPDLRDAISEEEPMTRDNRRPIYEAQYRADVCLASNYRDCD